MKFLIDSSEKSGKQVKAATINEQKGKGEQHIFYNILNPSNKIQCDDCKRDISKCTKVLAGDDDFCISCFANLDQYPNEYHLINKLDYPLFDYEWNGEEELLLFEGLQKHGYGNWPEIADFIGTNKTKEDVEEHYLAVFLDTAEFLPTTSVITKRDKEGKLVKTGKEGHAKKILKPVSKSNNSSSTPSFRINQSELERGSLTVNQLTTSLKTGSNPAEIVGYMPKRGDFQVEYDNDAELLLAQMEFNDDDSEEEKRMKFRLIDIYNHKLTERIRRKEFVISRKLLDIKEQTRLEKRTKQEKEIYNMMKVFARFSTPEDHDKLVQGIIKEKQIRQRLEDLKQLKKKGFRTLCQAQEQLQGKKKRDDKSRKKQDVYALADKSKSRRMRKQLMVQKSQKRSVYLCKQQQQLCKTFNINYKQYMMIKETIIRESVKQGIIQRDDTSKVFKIERNIVDGVFDFLVEKQQIITSSKDSQDIE